MKEQAAKGLFSFTATGNPPDRYEVTFSAPGVCLESRRITAADDHCCALYLHRDYPRRPPVITWKTAIFHPNILPPERNGGVCIGAWSAAESLPDLIGRLKDLASYRAFSLDDALDMDAAAWVARLGIRPGFNCGEILGVDVPEPDHPSLALLGSDRP